MHGTLVAPAAPSPTHPYLRRRQIQTATGWQPLVASVAGAAATGGDAKLVYDAATRFDRDGAFAELLPDGSGRAIAVRAAGRDRVAIAITEPAAPRPTRSS